MAKRISAKIGEYEKDGQTKGQYVDVGVILSNSNGEYIMLNPTVDLAGVMMKQRILAQKTGKKAGDNVLCSIFDRDDVQQKHATQQSGGAQDFNDDVPF